MWTSSLPSLMWLLNSFNYLPGSCSKLIFFSEDFLMGWFLPPAGDAALKIGCPREVLQWRYSAGYWDLAKEKGQPCRCDGHVGLECQSEPSNRQPPSVFLLFTWEVPRGAWWLASMKLAPLSLSFWLWSFSHTPRASSYSPLLASQKA